MARTLSGPYDISECGRRMVERIHANAFVVRAREKCIAGSETRSQHTQLLVALFLKPIKAATNINHRLPAGGKRATDISAHGVIGAFKLSGTSNVMIRLG